MKRIARQFKSFFSKPPKKLDPQNPKDRKKIVNNAVDRAVKEYGEALKRLGSE